MLEKPIVFGKDLPSNEELRQTVERERRLDAPSFSVSYGREAEREPDFGDDED